MSTPILPVIDTRPDRTKVYEPFKPILDRILVKKIEVVENVGDFTIPEKFRQQTNWGEVMAVGDGVMLGSEYVFLTDFVNVGDRVKFSEYTAERLYPEDETIYIIRLHDVRGVERLVKENS